MRVESMKLLSDDGYITVSLLQYRRANEPHCRYNSIKFSGIGYSLQAIATGTLICIIDYY
jgi:hypothetical protein